MAVTIPRFNFSGQHSYNVSPSTFNPSSTNQTPARLRPMRTTFNSGINGSLPWGLQYNFSGNISEQIWIVRRGSF